MTGRRMGAAKRAGLFMSLVVSASLACAGNEAWLTGGTGVSPTAPASSAWSVVDLPKAGAAGPIIFPTATEVGAAQLPLADPEVTGAPQNQSLITMEIVDEAVDPAPEVIPEAMSSSGKYVLVSISEQHLYAYQDGQLVFSFVASTGMNHSTRAGSFKVLDKIPNAYGANWDIWMPNWMGIYWSGTLENGIHALPILPSGARLWSGYLGTPISYGCVVLGVDEALQLYEWADIGTTVDIRN